jgi:hypothetical protein
LTLLSVFPTPLSFSTTTEATTHFPSYRRRTSFSVIVDLADTLWLTNSTNNLLCHRHSRPFSFGWPPFRHFLHLSLRIPSHEPSVRLPICFRRV